jgi:hypothetical protein
MTAAWRCVDSLAVVYDMSRVYCHIDYGDRIVRLNIGLENTDDLLADLRKWPACDAGLMVSSMLSCDVSFVFTAKERTVPAMARQILRQCCTGAQSLLS